MGSRPTALRTPPVASPQGPGTVARHRRRNCGFATREGTVASPQEKELWLRQKGQELWLRHKGPELWLRHKGPELWLRHKGQELWLRHKGKAAGGDPFSCG